MCVYVCKEGTSRGDKVKTTEKLRTEEFLFLFWRGGGSSSSSSSSSPCGGPDEDSRSSPAAAPSCDLDTTPEPRPALSLPVLESMDRTSSRRPEELIVPGFQHSANQNLPHHHDDDVDLEQLVNEMNSSMESVYSTQADMALLLNNGHTHGAHNHHHVHAAYPGHGQGHRRNTPPPPTSSPSRERLRHSQPMHIQAVRCLQEEHQLRPASLPAIPNPFPELCSPAGSPVLSPIQTSDNHVSVLTLPDWHLYTHKHKHTHMLRYW
ncbi:hypothetical protein INR49_023747, partial [Caranx melampygus]